MKASAENASWQKNSLLAWREIEGQIVIVSPSDSVLHELNETGSFIWKQLDGRRAATEIAADLTGEYDVKLEDAVRDTESLLEQLASRQLIVPAEMRKAGEPR